MDHPCYRHPDRVGSYYCQKDNFHMCDECACCHSPNIYCRFRTACVIHLLTKEGELAPCRGVRDGLDGEADSADHSKG
jgi:hypothetical protein